MNLKHLVSVSAVAMAFSANAALLVTSSTSTGANDGRTTPATIFGPAVLIFTPSVSGSLDSVGMFAANGNTLAPSGFGGYIVQVWQNTGGEQGTSLASFNFNSGTPGTFAGGDNEWRTQASSISLTAGTSYAISIRDDSNEAQGFYYGFGGVFDQDLGHVATSGVSAVYSGVFSSTPTVVIRTSAITPETVFSTAGAIGNATDIRIATGEFTAVPEPSTYALVAGAGLAGFGLWRRRSTKA